MLTLQIYKHNLIATKKNQEKVIVRHEELRKSVKTGHLFQVRNAGKTM